MTASRRTRRMRNRQVGACAQKDSFRARSHRISISRRSRVPLWRPRALPSLKANRLGPRLPTQCRDRTRRLCLLPLQLRGRHCRRPADPCHARLNPRLRSRILNPRAPTSWTPPSPHSPHSRPARTERTVRALPMSDRRGRRSRTCSCARSGSLRTRPTPARACRLGPRPLRPRFTHPPTRISHPRAARSRRTPPHRLPWCRPPRHQSASPLRLPTCLPLPPRSCRAHTPHHPFLQTGSYYRFTITQLRAGLAGSGPRLN